MNIFKSIQYLDYIHVEELIYTEPCQKLRNWKISNKYFFMLLTDNNLEGPSEAVQVFNTRFQHLTWPR